MAAPFRVCSGQGRGKRCWSVCYEARGREWWRPSDARGQVRRWASREAAQRFCDTLTVIGVEHALAREAADRLRAMGREGRARLYWPGVKAAYWGRDPFGLYTSDLM